jgi:hypothetical protein
MAVIPALVAGIYGAAGSVDCGEVDTWDKPRYDNGMSQCPT